MGIRGGPTTARCVALVALGATASLLPSAVGCSSGAEVSETIDDGSAASETTAALGAPSSEEQALAVYADSIDYYERAQATDPPQAVGEEAIEYLSGSALSETVDIIAQNVANDEYRKVDLTTNPTVVSSGDTQVVLSDCLVEVVTVYNAATNRPKAAEGRYVINQTIEVRLSEAGWRVDKITTEEAECTPPQ